MDIQGAAPTMLEQRCIEASMLAEVYAVLVGRFGEETALAVIEETIAKAAFAAGQAFAATASDGPSLEHFASVTSRWQAGGALVIANERREPDRVSFDVTRCRYAERYREMGLPEALAVRVSCLRDAAFAEGYSPCLRLERPLTIASGAAHCPFTFIWDRT